MKQLDTWNTEGSEFTVALQKAPRRLLREGKPDGRLSMFGLLTRDLTVPQGVSMSCSRNVSLLYFIKVSICNRLEMFFKKLVLHHREFEKHRRRWVESEINAQKTEEKNFSLNTIINLKENNCARKEK